MRIYLIRHGETTGDIEDRYGGDYDDNLTLKGVEQGKALADKLLGKDIQALFHSPRIRARHTAKIVSDKLGVFLFEENDLRETNRYGILTGMTKQEAMEKYPLEVEKLKEGHLSVVEGCEEYADFKRRALGVFSDLVRKEYDTIGIVSHGGVIRAFFREILQKGELSCIGDCSYCVLDYVNGNWGLVEMNGMEI